MAKGDDARALAASSPAGFAHVCSRGRWVPYEHLLLLNDYLLRMVAGEFDRLIVTMPPRHGKSELVSRYFPAWFLGRFPDRQVMLASYEADFARSWGRKARDVLEEWGQPIFGISVAREPRSADWWMIQGREGVMVTAGVGGPMTGKGAHLLVIDDPVKNAEDAGSQTIQAKHLEWWQSTASTRLMPGAIALLVMTRWNEADLGGRLRGEDGSEWRVLNLPALAEDGDELGRKVGEPLCAELYDKAALDRIRKQVGLYYWTAMYQQRPAPAEGFLFKRHNLRYWRQETRRILGADIEMLVLGDKERERAFDLSTLPRFQTTDAALSEKRTADWTVVATWLATPDGDLILLDLERRRFEEQQVAHFLKAQSDKHGRPPMWIERFGAGRSPLRTLSRDGYPIRNIPVEAGSGTDKITRSFGAVALAERNRLYLPAVRPGWLDDYEGELASFPNAKHDDMVDVTSYAARLLPTVTAGQDARAARRRGEEQAGARTMITAGIMTEAF